MVGWIFGACAFGFALICGLVKFGIDLYVIVEFVSFVGVGSSDFGLGLFVCVVDFV